MKAAHIPEETAFATKPTLAVAMIERAIAAAVPFAFVAADSIYGVAGVERALRRAGKGYVLGIASNHSINSWQDQAHRGNGGKRLQGLAPSDWKRLSAGDGAKGPRLYDWAYVELDDIDASEYEEGRSGLWTRGLLIRRTIADQELSFFPPGLRRAHPSKTCAWKAAAGPLKTLSRRQNELGLDHHDSIRASQTLSRHFNADRRAKTTTEKEGENG